MHSNLERDFKKYLNGDFKPFDGIDSVFGFGYHNLFFIDYSKLSTKEDFDFYFNHFHNLFFLHFKISSIILKYNLSKIDTYSSPNTIFYNFGEVILKPSFDKEGNPKICILITDKKTILDYYIALDIDSIEKFFEHFEISFKNIYTKRLVQKKIISNKNSKNITYEDYKKFYKLIEIFEY